MVPKIQDKLYPFILKCLIFLSIFKLESFGKSILENLNYTLSSYCL